MSRGRDVEENVRVHLLVTGRVQGVFFRVSTQRRAVELGIAGWVRNSPDGRVEITAEGPRPACEALRAYCEQGPPPAHVDMVDTTWQTATGEFSGFDVRY